MESRQQQQHRHSRGNANKYHRRSHHRQGEASATRKRPSFDVHYHREQAEDELVTDDLAIAATFAVFPTPTVPSNVIPVASSSTTTNGGDPPLVVNNNEEDDNKNDIDIDDDDDDSNEIALESSTATSHSSSPSPSPLMESDGKVLFHSDDPNQTETDRSSRMASNVNHQSATTKEVENNGEDDSKNLQADIVEESPPQAVQQQQLSENVSGVVTTSLEVESENDNDDKDDDGGSTNSVHTDEPEEKEEDESVELGDIYEPEDEEEEEAEEGDNNKSSIPKTAHEIDTYHTNDVAQLESLLGTSLSIQEEQIQRRLRDPKVKLVLAGRIQHHFIEERIVVVQSEKSLPVHHHHQQQQQHPSFFLEEGNLLVFSPPQSSPAASESKENKQSWIPLGKVLEVFGPVSQPLYSIRLPNKPNRPPPPTNELTMTPVASNATSEEPTFSETSNNEGKRSVVAASSPSLTATMTAITNEPSDASITMTTIAQKSSDTNYEEERTVGVEHSSFVSTDTAIAVNGPNDKCDVKVAKTNNAQQEPPSDPWSVKGEYTRLLQSKQKQQEHLAVYYLWEDARFIDPQKVYQQSSRGCDASNMYDEEISNPHEMYFSDDEEERQATRRSSSSIKNKNNRRGHPEQSHPNHHQDSNHSNPNPNNRQARNNHHNSSCGGHPMNRGQQQQHPQYHQSMQNQYTMPSLGASSVPPPPPMAYPHGVPPTSHAQGFYAPIPALAPHQFNELPGAPPQGFFPVGAGIINATTTTASASPALLSSSHHSLLPPSYFGGQQPQPQLPQQQPQQWWTNPNQYPTSITQGVLTSATPWALPSGGPQWEPSGLQTQMTRQPESDTIYYDDDDPE